jgi:hypothetical protein
MFCLYMHSVFYTLYAYDARYIKTRALWVIEGNSNGNFYYKRFCVYASFYNITPALSCAAPLHSRGYG